MPLYSKMVYEGGGGVEKIQKTVYVVYERPLIFSSLLMKVLDNFHSSQLHEMVMEELNLGSTLNLRE